MGLNKTTADLYYYIQFDISQLPNTTHAYKNNFVSLRQQ